MAKAKVKCFHGIRKVCSLTKDLKGYYCGEYLELFYDKKEDRIWSRFHYDLGHNERTYYEDKNIIRVGNVCVPLTMKDIKDITLEALMYANNSW